MHLSVLRVFFPILVLFVSVSAGADETQYQAGVAAFRAGDYDLALAQFTAAYDAGRRDARLYYNLGSVQFKRGDYAAAQEWFEMLTDDPNWAPLAEYNLGLIQERLQNPERARKHFEIVWQTADSDKLKRLAGSKLGRAPTPRRSDNGWSGLVSLGGGYDDNVVLLNDQSLVGVSNRGDYFGEALAGASRYVSGDLERGWRADATGYFRGYRDQHDYDFGSVGLGLYHSRLVAEQHWQLGGSAEAQFVGSDPYTASATLNAQWLGHAGPFLLRIRNDLAYIDGASRFDYLTGWRDRFGVHLTRTLGATRVRFGYEFEINDRRDDQTATEFFSYSPIWNRFYGQLTYGSDTAVEIEARAEYGFSHYRDDNVETNPDGSVTKAARNDDRIAASLRATYHRVPPWGVFAEYSYTDNSSRFSEYEYTDNQFLLGIERTF